MANTFGEEQALKVQQMLLGKTAEEVPSRQWASVAKGLNKMYDVYESQVERNAIYKEVESHRLGYASVYFTTDNNLGCGPTIARGILNPHTVSQNAISDLITLHGNQKLNQRSTESPYHITLLVRKMALDTTKLTKNITEVSYPQIQWVANITEVIQANGDKPLALVANGNH